MQTLIFALSASASIIKRLVFVWVA
jgi:hypothetical protein